ncbi:MAG: hypothetical protein JSS30_07785 [Verrucomicrobia bacterium]|nr:hypothetical protein [Verrucomicrobiota bacterium]
MVDRPLDRVDRPRDEGVYVSRIEDKKKESKYSPQPPKETKQILLATFFSYLKKMFDTFSPSKQLVSKVVDQQKIIENLLLFKKLLEKLSEKDLSQSAEFASKLSTTWCLLLEDFDTIEIMERKNLKEISNFREMMSNMKNYPPESEHRLGYYLVQHAGQDWLPFPFIEILSKLHTQHQAGPKTSTLSSWFKQIDTVIAGLSLNQPFKGF